MRDEFYLISRRRDGRSSLNGVVERIATTMTGDLPALASPRPISMPVDGSLVFVALLLVALARIFHRGSDLEQDQSLVV